MQKRTIELLTEYLHQIIRKMRQFNFVLVDIIENRDIFADVRNNRILFVFRQHFLSKNPRKSRLGLTF